MAILARVTGARKGVVLDASIEVETAKALFEALDAGASVRTKRGAIKAVRTPAYAEIRGDGALEPRRLGADQSNTSLAFGQRLVLKLFRRVESGPNPDVEIGVHLTGRTDFRRAPRVAGAFEYEAPGEPVAHLGVAQELVKSQADGWTHALSELARFLDEVPAAAPPSELLPSAPLMAMVDRPTPTQMCDLAGAFMNSAETLGRRTAELHLALASDSSTAAFVPEPLRREDVQRVMADAAAQARRASAVLDTQASALPVEVRGLAVEAMKGPIG